MADGAAQYQVAVVSIGCASPDPLSRRPSTIGLRTDTL